MSRCMIGPLLNEDLNQPNPGCEPEPCKARAHHSVVIRTDSPKIKVPKVKVKLCNEHFYLFRMNRQMLGHFSNTMEVLDARRDGTIHEINEVRVDYTLRENRL